MITMHRSFPNRKTLGTRYNLKPDTQPVEARRLQSGDIVVLEPDCPTVITKMHRWHGGTIRVWGRYIWQADFDPHWQLGDFGESERVARALPGEYPKTTR